MDVIDPSQVAITVASITTGGFITPDGTKLQFNITGLTSNPTIEAPSGTPVDGQQLIIRIKDNGTARSIAWITSSGGYRTIGCTLPTSTVAGMVLYVGCIYNSQDGYWDMVAVAEQ
jgi:hypothetical protein